MNIYFSILLILLAFQSSNNTISKYGSSVVLQVKIELKSGESKCGILDINGYDEIHDISFYKSNFDSSDWLKQLNNVYSNFTSVAIYREVEYISNKAKSESERNKILEFDSSNFTLGYCLESNFEEILFEEIKSIQIVKASKNPRNWLGADMKLVKETQFKLLKSNKEFTVEEISLDTDNLYGFLLIDYNISNVEEFKNLKNNIKRDFSTKEIKSLQKYQSEAKEIVIFEVRSPA